MPGVASSVSMSATPRRAPAVSKAVAGTQLGAPNSTWKGVCAALASIQRTPSRPSTLAISCGSETLATVPWRTARRANSAGGSRLLSICTWASMKPGIRQGQAGFAAPSSSMRPITPADQPISAAKMRRAAMSTRLARTLPDGVVMASLPRDGLVAFILIPRGLANFINPPSAGILKAAGQTRISPPPCSAAQHFASVRRGEPRRGGGCRRRAAPRTGSPPCARRPWCGRSRSRPEPPAR